VTAPRGWRARLLVLGSFALMFAAGAFAGVAWERARDAQPMFRVMVDGGRTRIDALDELGLTDAQRQQIDGVFRRAQPRTDAVMKEMLPRLRAVTDSVNAELQAVLTPEQRRRLGRVQPRRVFELPHDSAHQP
jgi:Spy/CpxP family protein refolding chaperone